MRKRREEIGMSADFHDLLSRIRREAEDGIKSELSRRGFIDRSVFRMFMPLAIDIITDVGKASMTISKDGTIGLEGDLSRNPDITLRADFDMLHELYDSRDSEVFRAAEAQGEISISGHTAKGRQAEARLRELLGG